MKFGDKQFDFYWKAMKLPFFLFVGWSVIGVVIINFSEELFVDIFFNKLVSSGIPILLFLLAGYLAFAEFKFKGKEIAWTGALIGFCASVIGVCITIFMIKTTGYLDIVIAESLAAVAASGQVVDPDQVSSMIKLSVNVGFVLNPFVSGLMGALFGWLGGLIGKYFEG